MFYSMNQLCNFAKIGILFIKTKHLLTFILFLCFLHPIHLETIVGVCKRENTDSATAVFLQCPCATAERRAGGEDVINQ